MDDQNDFFDDVIDDEAESPDSEWMDGDDDDEAEDDDEPYEVRTVVMTKNGMVALLSLKISAAGGQIVRVDPRQTIPAAQNYEEAPVAAKWFKRSLATSRKNGWDVAYDGEPLFG